MHPALRKGPLFYKSTPPQLTISFPAYGPVIGDLLWLGLGGVGRGDGRSSGARECRSPRRHSGGRDAVRCLRLRTLQLQLRLRLRRRTLSRTTLQPGTILCHAQFTPPARHDKTVLSVSCQAVCID